MPTDTCSVDELEQRLLHLESMVSRIRAAQIEVVAELDAAQICTVDGARTLGQWVTGRLDVAPETGRALAYAAVSESRALEDELAFGEATFDRVVAVRRLANGGADPTTLERAAGVGVQQVRRLISRHGEVTPVQELALFQTRRLFAQPDLANTSWNVHGRLPALDGEVVFRALDDQADTLISRTDPHRPTLPQRRADALVSWAMNQLDPAGSRPGKPSGSKRLAATVHIDHTLAKKTAGRAGVTTRHGLKTGSNTLTEALCAGTVTGYVIGEGSVRTVDLARTTIPKPVRDYVWHRDGGCTADGCVSMYRLEPHHIRQRAHGGDHHPDNLTLLCWYHHHVVVHQQGFTIDRGSPSGRRRFIRPTPDRDPPDT